MEANLTPYARYIHRGTEIIFQHRATCAVQDICSKCMKFGIECNWNPKLDTCYDRRLTAANVYNKDGLVNRICPIINSKRLNEDSKPPISPTVTRPHTNVSAYENGLQQLSSTSPKIYVKNIIIICVLLFLVSVVAVCIWAVCYAKHSPDSRLGQILVNIRMSKYTRLTNTSNKSYSVSELQMTSIGITEGNE